MDLSKLGDVVKNYVLKKDVYNSKIKNIEDKIPDITDLANTTLNAKINEVKNKRLNITNLAITTALTTVENKIPDHSKYITTQEFNKLTVEHFAARLAQENLASEKDIVNFVKKTYFYDKLKNFNKRITSNKAKHVLLENGLNELSEKVKAISTKGLTKDLINKFSILNGAKCFYSGILQIILYLYQLKNSLNILVILLGFIRGNLMECQKKILKI